MSNYKCNLCDATFETKKGNITRFTFTDYLEFGGKPEPIIDYHEDICWSCKRETVIKIQAFLMGELIPRESGSREDNVLLERLKVLENQMKTLFLLIQVGTEEKENGE